jgi:diguanylate cyclase (GGDEF)-like protein
MTAPTPPGADLSRPSLPWLRELPWKTPEPPLPRPQPHSQARGDWKPSLGIRRSVLLGFMMMCGFTGAVGYYSARMIRQSAGLVVGLFDDSLMPIDYARAAGADFANMKTNFVRQRLATTAQNLHELDDRGRDLSANFDHDLGISELRAQSERAKLGAAAVRQAVQDWQAAIKAMDPHLALSDVLFRLDEASAAVDHRIDMLVNLTAGDGFLYREQALRSIRAETIFAVAATLAGLLLSVGVTWVLSRRIAGPIAAASEIAERIAGGDLGVAIPEWRRDELGSLLRSMGVMRDSIKAMMLSEVSERRSAQARLMDAIETTHEGVVLVDASGRIVVTNAPILQFFGPPEPAASACFTISDLLRYLARSRLSEESLQSVGALTWKLDRDTPGTMELSLRDGMWLRVSWCATREGGLVAFFSDITLARHREVQLTQTNLWFDAALSHMVQGLCVYDHDGDLKIFNSRFADIYTIPRDQLRLKMPFAQVQDMLDGLADTSRNLLAPAEQRATLMHHIAARHVFTDQQYLVDGRVIAVSHRPISDGGWVLTYEDVTARARSDARIAFMAQHDPLTGLPNRSLFAERLDCALASLPEGGSFALALIDLDRFKEVNDTRGHAMGDRLLRVVAERLIGCCRPQDTVARLGGDEFAIIQTGLQDVYDAKDLAARVMTALGNPFAIDGGRLEMCASIGIALAPDHGSSQETLLRNADTALYRVKAEGRCSYRVFSPSMDTALQDRRVLEHDLLTARFETEMELFYQPIIDIRPPGEGSDGINRIAGFEALLRWHHPTRGLMMPGDFIGIAEDIGLIEKLGAWILRRACADARDWAHDVKVAVNVSPIQFRSGHLIERLSEALAQTGIAASRLELEITETTLLDDNEATVDTLRQIQRLGVKIALDDFGTGFSSLSYLRSFPFDRIKIDRSFVMDLGQRPDAAAIIRAILGLGRSLGIPVTAEGVETPEQLAHLQAEGCALAQGYLFSRPVSTGSIAGLTIRTVGVPLVGL